MGHLAMGHLHRYTGNDGPLGQPDGGPTRSWVMPHFNPHKDAPAVLGFDESIDWYCSNSGGYEGNLAWHHAHNCVEANANILSLHGFAIPYNLCRNLEWRVPAGFERAPIPLVYFHGAS